MLQALVHFAGGDTIKRVYSDRAPTLIAAVRSLPGVPAVHTTSIPGVPQTNSIAESRVKIMIRGIRVTLLAAGLPHCYWHHAAKYYAFMRTVVKKGNASIFAKRHGSEHFQGPLIPFGALIKAMPSAIQDGRRLKFEHTLQPAIFLGYIVQPGCRWYREFCYVFLDDIACMSFYRKARWSKVRVTVHSGKGVVFEKDQVTAMPVGLHGGQRDDRRCAQDLVEMDESERSQEEEDGEHPHAEQCPEDVPDTSEGEETTVGPKYVEFEPFPQDVADKIDSLRQQEQDLAWT